MRRLSPGLLPALLDVLLHSPRLTPFPYTTLFRSDETAQGPGQHRCGSQRDDEADQPRVLARPAQRADPERGGEGCCEDRKSTRLNSSHLVISYAVFCS